jgi:Ala-tRNA(Pro) deacylase
MDDKIAFDFFAANSINYKLFKHQPVFTTADKPVLVDSGGVEVIPGLHSKSLLLKDSKNNAFFLVSVTEDKRVDLKELGHELGSGRLSFAKPEELLMLLKLEPGSVTPFGLLFDQQKRVVFVLDEDFLKGAWINFHPLRNDMTVSLDPESFLRCMEEMEHYPYVIRIPIKKS